MRPCLMYATANPMKDELPRGAVSLDDREVPRSEEAMADVVLAAASVGLGLGLAGGIRLVTCPIPAVTWTIPAVTWPIPAVVNWRLRPYALLGLPPLPLPRGVSLDWLRGPYRLPSTRFGCVFYCCKIT